ncbi:MFS transporter [Thalassococcus profundi]|uniref:MFS transporter n=1 Tax=Thalassococcus profundi TaxID=2282382 RepID=UPI00405A0C54
MTRPADPALTVVVLWLAGLGAAGQFAKIAVAFPALQALYPQAGTSLGLAVSLISLLGALLGVVAGMIVARLGLRRMLLWGLWLGAALSLAQAILPGLGALLATRLVEGLSHLVIVVAAPTLISETVADRWRGAALTLWSTFFGVAFALFAWAGLPLVDSHGPGALFALHGAWMAAMALWLSVLLPTARLVRVTDPLTWRAVLARHAAIYRSPALSAPALGWLCYTLTFVSLLTLLPAVMEPSSPGWLLGALPLTSIAVALTLGVALLRKLSAVQVILLGFAASAIAVAALLALPGPLWPVFALFAALALVQSASFAAVPELASDPADRALANGALAQMGNVGNLLGMPLLLAILGLGGATAGLLAVMTAYLAGLGLHLALARAHRARA